MRVLVVANTVLAKKGNIGYRLSKVFLRRPPGIEQFHFIARGCAEPSIRNVRSLVFQKHAARLLNAISIYVYRNFRHRVWDLALFELTFYVLYKFLDLKKQSLPHRKVAHVVEPSPKIIRKLKNDGYRVVLDIPIAPSAYAERLNKDFGVPIKGNPDFIELEKEAIMESDIILVPSEFVKEQVCKIVSDSRVSVVPFGVDFVNNEAKRKPNAEELHFCFAGNACYRKGIEYLLEAWEAFRETNHKLHLCGRLYPEATALLKKKAYNNVVTPGFVNTNTYFENCDVYVFPSAMEGSSKSVYEAMNMSLPVITTFESGSIIRQNVDGVIIDKCNVQQIVEAIERFINSPELITTMGKNAKKHVREYSWENYAKNVNRIYEDAALIDSDGC